MISIPALLRQLADAIEAQTSQPAADEWFTSATYPHGAKSFRAHIKRGMKAIRVGKAYRVRRDDAEAFWATLAHKPTARTRKLSADEERWARAGIRVAS